MKNQQLVYQHTETPDETGYVLAEMPDYVIIGKLEKQMEGTGLHVEFNDGRVLFGRKRRAA